jgi:hypothetical protein
MTMTRKCGDCTLCCRLVGVEELHKRSGERCVHQRFNGCAIYASRPVSCQMWSCRWLVDEDCAELRRPDRSHYVVDIMPDFITCKQDGKSFDVPVVQIWCDPKHPNAHRDPALRAYLHMLWKRDGIVALVRFDGQTGLSLLPLDNGTFIEKVSDQAPGPTHSFEQVMQVLNGDAS